MKELIEQKNDLITRAEEIVNAAKGEQRALTDAEAAEVEQIRENVKGITRTLELEADVEGMEKFQPKEEVEERAEKAEGAKEVQEKEIQERNAFENYIRGFIVHERSGELSPTVWTSGSTPAGAGGALIPTSIVNQIIKKVYDVCPILARSQRYTQKGKLQLPYYPADTNKITVAYQTEFSALSSSSGSFTSIELGGFLAGALTKISRSLINNTEFDVVNFIVTEMGDSIARFIEKELLVGTSGKVTGMSTLSNSVTSAGATQISLDNIIDLHDSIKDIYQKDAIWIMNSTTRTYLRKLKGQTGYPLLNDDISAPFGASILGKPVFVSDNMPAMAHGNKAIYYGDMSGLATKFSEQMNIQVLRERYADEHAIGVIGWLEFDSKVANEQKMAVLTMA